MPDQSQFDIGLALPNAAPIGETSAPVYFLHIPKTAGTTLHTFMTTQFGAANVCPAHLWHQMLAVPPEQAASYPFIWGHFYAYLHRYVPGRMRYISFLRDPVERALSHYAHIMFHTGHYLNRRATDLGSFSAFLRDPVMATTLTNFQVRSLTLDLDPIKLAAHLSPGDLANNELERLLETVPPTIHDRDSLEIAKHRLEQMCFVGITEQWDQSIAVLCQTFGWIAPPNIASQNISPQRLKQDQLSPVDLALLRDINAADYTLYNFALARLKSEDSSRNTNPV
jgi:hypothetical protein